MTIASIDDAFATWDEVDRALAFSQAISDAQSMIRRLAAERQRAITDAQAVGKSLDTIAVEMGITRAQLIEFLDGQTVRTGDFAHSSPARRG